MLAATTRHILAASTTRFVVAVLAIIALGAGAALANNGFLINGATLTKRPDGSWSGPGTVDGVKGTLTLTGTIVLLKQSQHKIHFTWVAGKRRVSGCSYNEVLTRPHGVQLWDGSGQITKTSAQERRYTGVHVSLSGPTQRNDLKHARISVAAISDAFHK
ncbi:MAG: hypothetical protein ACXWZZ_04975, partial [Solirubrobacteraceae bacterium]